MQMAKILLKFVIYGVQVIGACINIYSIIWHSGSVYLFGLVDTCILPMNPESAYGLEQALAVLQTLKFKYYLASSFIIDVENFVLKKEMLNNDK
ncbi:hypothetical protein F8M41_024225 [Gigaspora margarita]|uniref:Uncharacterized protein n=1 Tax=Gigaspora margarita TaxID=4874 RepID=A0A8H4AC42_GIGMA|nr:hypothetical protein F8M41_024225 [Gigaspora margarita]